MQLRSTIDCLIPRGGPSLIRSILEHATVPYVIDGDGNCHVYVDAGADLDVALDIVVNAKTQRPSVCNAAETLLVHQAVAAEFLPRVVGALEGVELVGDDRARDIAAMGEASDDDWAQEFLDLKLAVGVVDDLTGAIDHVNRYGTGHSEAIITGDLDAAPTVHDRGRCRRRADQRVDPLRRWRGVRLRGRDRHLHPEAACAGADGSPPADHREVRGHRVRSDQGLSRRVVERRPALVLAMYDGLERYGIAEAQWDRLRSLAVVLDERPLAAADDPRAPALLAEAEVVLGHWGSPPFDAALLDLAPSLRLFAFVAGTLKMTVDRAIFERGVAVTSAAHVNARPTAEFALAAILLAGKDAFAARERLRPGADDFPWAARRPRAGNVDKRVGLVGASKVGRWVIELLRPFRLEVAVADPFLSDTEAETLGVVKLELDELLRTSPVVSVHVPALPSTIGMIGARELALLRDGATLVNTARGLVVDPAALEAELRSGRINAVLDVTEPEPLPAGAPLLELPNVFVTPHIAGSQGTELGPLMDAALEEIEAYVEGRPPLHPVRVADLDTMA